MDKAGVITQGDFKAIMETIKPQYLQINQGDTKLMDAGIEGYTTMTGGVMFIYGGESAPHYHFIPYGRIHYLKTDLFNGQKELNIILI